MTSYAYLTSSAVLHMCTTCGDYEGTWLIVTDSISSAKSFSTRDTMQVLNTLEVTEGSTKLDEPDHECDPPHTRLIFNPDDMWNTIITQEGIAQYIVRSAQDKFSTEIFDAKGALMARIVYRLFSSDTITFHGVTRKVKQWLSSRKQMCVVIFPIFSTILWLRMTCLIQPLLDDNARRAAVCYGSRPPRTCRRAFLPYLI